MVSTYFTPSYFSPTYFPNLSIPMIDDKGADPTPRLGRERDAYKAIVDAMTATSAFDQVLFGYAGARSRAGAGRYPVLMVTPKGWEETDDADPTTLIRKASSR